MDYSQVFEDYLAGYGNFEITITQVDESTYSAELYYCDDQIETYLGKGLTILLSIEGVAFDEVDNSVSCVFTLVDFDLPGVTVTITDDGLTSVKDCMFACEYLEDLSKVAYDFLHYMDFDKQFWLSVD